MLNVRKHYSFQVTGTKLVTEFNKTIELSRNIDKRYFAIQLMKSKFCFSIVVIFQ